MLSGQDIRDAVFIEHNIVIEPFNEKQVQPNGYDLTIGGWIIRYRTYGKQQHMTIELDDVELKHVFTEPEYIPDGNHILFRPMERILCHTQEIIGTLDKYVMQVSTRSTLARWGIDVCGSAGFGDVGFVNKWTLELQNNTHGTIAIPVGARVAQAYFEEVTGDIRELYTGKYNSDATINWKPEDMLPKKVEREWVEELGIR